MLNWTVVIPLKDEVSTIWQQVSNLRNMGIREVIVAVDCKTTEYAIRAARDAGARVITTEQGTKGLANIYRYALGVCAEEAISDVIVEMDSGGSHCTCDMYRFILAMNNSTVDVVLGERFSKKAVYKAPWNRKLLSWCGTVLTNLLDYPFSFDKWWKDGTSGYIAYRTKALQQILSLPQKSSGYYYQTEVRRHIRKLGLIAKEVPIEFKSSSSSLKIKHVFEAIILAFKKD
jgi:hypothetical protein